MRQKVLKHQTKTKNVNEGLDTNLSSKWNSLEKLEDVNSVAISFGHKLPAKKKKKEKQKHHFLRVGDQY